MTTRRGLGALRKVPGVGIRGDGVAARYRVPDLVEMVQRDPLDPLANYWLAVALANVEAGNATYEQLMSWDIQRRVTRGVIRRLAGQGPNTMPASERQMRRTYQVARHGLHRSPRNPRAMDVLGRVYAYQGKAYEGVRFCRLAIGTDADYTAAYVTLGLLYVDGQRWDDARAAARAAIRRGDLMGHRVLQLSGDYGLGEVPLDARVRYAGPLPLGFTEAIRAAGREQTRKAQQLKSHVVGRDTAPEQPGESGGAAADLEAEVAPPPPPDASSRPSSEPEATARPVWVTETLPGPNPAGSLQPPPPVGPPAGWYDDRDDDQLLRYWDGDSWTAQTARKAAP